jgi:hypothetical protein
MKLSTTVICIFLIVSMGFSQKLGRYTLEEWQAIIDTTWGEGLLTEDKLQIFDLFWNTIDQGYAGFQNLYIDWDSLKNEFRPEIEAGVSRGRFYGIISYLNQALRETHTNVLDLGIYKYKLKPGIPLLVYQSGYYYNDHGHFGAGLTPLPDSSLLVYKVIENHPLGLEPGDIVLGYDGIPWKDLYKEFLDAHFPITSLSEPLTSLAGVYFFGGSSDKSAAHLWLISAGLNWHLFDIIDIVKYGSIDTLHLETSSLINLDIQLICTEQLRVPGVPMPDYSQTSTSWITWGLVEGTQIGYIYVPSWADILGDAEAFTNAVNTLLDDYQTEGLIIDSRLNAGGQMSTANGGFSRLFNFNLAVLEMAQRADPNDHFAMKKVTGGSCSGQYWRFTADSYLYDKPIAVLTGPSCWSAGDYNAMRLKFHPMTKFFGKPTNTAFTCHTAHINFLSSYPGWYGTYSLRNVYLIDNPDKYLMHTGFNVDEEIWLTQEDVVNGEDTVVKRAIEWIQNLAYAHDVVVNKTYAQPGIDSVIVTTQVENPNQHELSIIAYINNMNGVTIDSLTLFDYGDHGDGAANDNIWGNFYLPTGEQSYKISVTTNDLTEETSRTLPNVAWFTTIGPVVFDHFEFTSTDTVPNPGDQITIRIFLWNDGSVETASNITAKLSSPDTSVTVNTVSYLWYGDIGPGEISKASTNYLISFKGPFDKNIYQVPFTLEIRSGYYTCWIDTTFSIPVGIKQQEGKPIPEDFTLYQNYPNPFNLTTMINYQLPMTSIVELSVYNLLGQKVATLVAEKQKAGRYKVEWDASGFAGGVYFYRLTTDTGFSETKKLLYLK